MKKYLFLAITSVTLVTSLVLLFIFPPHFTESKKAVSIAALSLVFLTLVSFFISLILLIKTKTKYEENKLNKRLEMWSEVSFNINEISDKLLNQLPICVLALNELSEVTFINEYAKKIFPDLTQHTELSEFSKELAKQIETYQAPFLFKINQRDFDVIYDGTAHSILMYDVSEREHLRQLYFNKTTVIGFIEIENLDEQLTKLEIAQQSALRSKFFIQISEWFAKFSGFFKSFGNEKFLFVSDRLNLDKMIGAKFEIIDQINQLSKDNNVLVSLSMGVAAWATLDLLKNAQIAQEALELAQNRGGGQAVVNIENENVQFFGAKVDSVQKHNAVSSRFNAETIKAEINRAKNVVIMGHTDTDTDSFGSALLLYLIAKEVKKDGVYLYYHETQFDETARKVAKTVLAENPSFLSSFLSEDQILPLISEDTLLICVDTSIETRLISPAVYQKAERVLTIDHHRQVQGNFEKALFQFIEPNTSSVCEMIISLIPFFGLKLSLTQTEASAVLAGIVVDTNSFTFRTSANTFAACSYLKEKDANMILVKDWLRNQLASVQLINDAVAGMQVFLDRFGFISVYEQISDRTLLAQIAEAAVKIENIDAAFAIAKIGQDVYVSARSIKQNINVQLILEQIGGGGHFQAAAAKVVNANINEVAIKLRYIVDAEYNQKGENMKVILKKDFKKNKARDLIEVTAGYAKYLFNEGIAEPASEENLKAREQFFLEKAEQEKEAAKMYSALKANIETKTVVVTVKTGEGGKMFGAVTTKHIADALAEQHEIIIDKKKVELENPINSTGRFLATIRFNKDFIAKLTVDVRAQNHDAVQKTK